MPQALGLELAGGNIGQDHALEAEKLEIAVDGQLGGCASGEPGEIRFATSGSRPARLGVWSPSTANPRPSTASFRSFSDIDSTSGSPQSQPSWSRRVRRGVSRHGADVAPGKVHGHQGVRAKWAGSSRRFSS